MYYSESQLANANQITKWDEATKLDISNGAHVTFTPADKTAAIIVDTDSQVYIKQDNSASDTTSDNSIRLPKGTHTIGVAIPLRKNGTVYIHFKQVSSEANSYVRIVEISEV